MLIERDKKKKIPKGTEDLTTTKQLDPTDIYATLRPASAHFPLRHAGRSPAQTTGSAVRQASEHSKTLNSHSVLSDHNETELQSQ